MAVDKDTVRHVAHLARIRLSEADVAKLEGELNLILNWIEQLGEINTDGVAPMTSAVEIAMKKRVDEITDGNIADEVIKNAPLSEDHYFMVPKVVE